MTSPLSMRKRLKLKHLQKDMLLHMRDSSGYEFAVPDEIIAYATKKNQWLNDYNDTFFSPAFLKKSDQLCTWINTKPGHDSFPEPFMLEGETQKICGTFFNRNSDTLVVVGPGFNNKHEQMASCIKIFPRYDVVLFDFPGHGLHQNEPCNAYARIIKQCVGLDLSKITLGPAEIDTVITVTNYFKHKKTYKKVVGVGFCYSVMFLVQATAQWGATHAHPLFDKLILDSSWAYYETLIQNLPLLYVSKLHSPLLNAFCASYLIKKLFLVGAQLLIRTRFDDLLPLTHYTAQLTQTDLLFVHSDKDIAISNQEFETIWHSLQKVPYKSALFTHNKHVRNHFSQKELFKFFGELFIERSMLDFMAAVTDPLVAYALYEHL